MKLYHIVRADGYSIDSLVLTSDAKEATSIMKNDYTAHMPDSLEESEAEMSYCGATEAMLYNNGEDVFVWSVFTVNTSDKATKQKIQYSNMRGK